MMRKIDADAFYARVAPECKFPELLKAQLDAEPTVEEPIRRPMTLEEMKYAARQNRNVYIEINGNGLYYAGISGADIFLTAFQFFFAGVQNGIMLEAKDYNTKWRGWEVIQPSYEERKAAKWDE